MLDWLRFATRGNGHCFGSDPNFTSTPTPRHLAFLGPFLISPEELHHVPPYWCLRKLYGWLLRRSMELQMLAAPSSEDKIMSPLSCSIQSKYILIDHLFL